jgi:hypothetical protein
MEFKKMFDRKQAGSNREETRKRSEDRGSRIDGRLTRRKTIFDLGSSILDPRVFAILFL